MRRRLAATAALTAACQVLLWSASWAADRVGVFRPQTAQFYLDLNGSGGWDSCVTDGCLPKFGLKTDLPVAGDWTGSGASRVGVFRPTTGQWFLDLNDNGVWDGCTTDACLPKFGLPTDLPVAGDWTGSGLGRVGVFRPATGQWFLDLNGNGAWDGCATDACLPKFGLATDLPVAGDWTGSGVSRAGVFRPTTGQWFLDLTGNGAWDGCAADACLTRFGTSSDLPVAGEWGFTSTWPQLGLVGIATGFDAPVHITHAGDGSGRLFVVERAGRIRIVANGTVLAAPFLDLTAVVGSAGAEQGLLSVAFPPGYAGKGYFYVDYTDLAGTTVVARYRRGADPNVADPASGETLLAVPQPFANHNGGQLAFGPDGFLYVGLGDGGGVGDPLGNAQDPGSLLGKILRLDVESGGSPYVIPAGNPFGDEIWALGLRNPWRFSFDRGGGDLYVADVGQSTVEEVDVQPAAGAGGVNYGWNVMEGSGCYAAAACDGTGLTLPVFEYGHADGDCSVTGGFVYRGQTFPTLQGIYLLGDYCSGRIRGLRRAGSGWHGVLLLDTAMLISTFGEDEAGNLYVADYATGDIHQVVVTTAP